MSDRVRILHLEDNPADAELVALSLRAAGLIGELVQVDNREDFAAALDRESFDAVISDYALPGFDGLGALAMVRERRLDVPFILVSGTRGAGHRSHPPGRHRLRAEGRPGTAGVGSAPGGGGGPRAAAASSGGGDAGTGEASAEGRARQRRRRHRGLRFRRRPHRGQPQRARVARADGRRPRPAGLGRTVGGPLRGRPDPLAARGTPLRRALRGEVVRGLEMTMVGWSTPNRRLLASGQPILDAEGRRLGAVLAMHDVSNMKRAEEELRHQREALYQSEKLATMGTLLASVAHELNNPLSVVRGQANLLRRDAGSGPLAVRAEKIEKASERCARIVANFLALARQRPPERQQVDLREVVEAAVELLAYSLQLDRVETRLELAEDVPCIQADSHQLQQVLINLITNAHHAVRPVDGPRRITVRTRFDPERSRVILGVSDSGPGVPAELRQRIFEPFFTTKPADRGTGLGLPLCQEIVQAHGGTIGVGEEEGGGALFWIELPVGHAVPVAAEPVPEVLREVVARSILAVDDEPEVAEVLADLIFTDMKMPDLDGKTLLREASGLDPALPRRFVFTTGDGLSLETQGFFDASGLPILRKPYDLSEVHRVVARVLAAAE